MKTYIHIGLIKTGSTFLQRTVFSKFGELDGRAYIGATVNMHQYNILSKEYSHILISNENIAGHPLNNREPVTWLQQFKNSIRNLKEIYRDPHIIIGFREPAAMVQSVYKQSLNEWGIKSWKQYIKEADDNYLDQFEFSKYVEVLLDNFEKGKLFIYNHQYLLKSPEILLSRLNVFLDVPEYQDNIDYHFKKRENVSIPLNLENTLLSLNRLSFFMQKYFGFRLALKLGVLRINPAIICKNLILLTRNSNSKRDLSKLISRYRDDWNYTQKLIKSVE